MKWMIILLTGLLLLCGCGEHIKEERAAYHQQIRDKKADQPHHVGRFRVYQRHVPDQKED